MSCPCSKNLTAEQAEAARKFFGLAAESGPYSNHFTEQMRVITAALVKGGEVVEFSDLDAITIGNWLHHAAVEMRIRQGGEQTEEEFGIREIERRLCGLE